MTKHSVAEAKNKLPELIDRALEGESVIITRHGRPVVELRPFVAPAPKISQADIDWLDRHRVGDAPPAEDAEVSLARMRDEDWR